MRRRPLSHGAWLSAGLLSASWLAGGSAALARDSTQAPGQSQGQVQATATDTSATETAIKQHAAELEAARARQKRTAEIEERLRAEIAAIGQDRAKLNTQLIDIAAQVRNIETRISDTEASLTTLDGREQQMRASLAARHAETAEVLAALQRAGRHMPPALFVRPEDSLQSLRTAMLLGAVVPEMRARAERLVADLGELANIRTTIAAERSRLNTDREKLDTDRTRLAALVDERQKKQSETEKFAAAEHQRALEFSRQVQDLQGLINKLEKDLETAAKAAAAAEAAAHLQASRDAARAKPSLDAFKDPSRLTPALAFASIKGTLALPVNGSVVHRFGGRDATGGIRRGISLATQQGAQVTTPSDGWVVYAGPFRSYGQLLILNAGGGYHILLAGMERISVTIGQFVLTGEPVATMGSPSRVASILSEKLPAGAGRAVLYIEFRKDGTPIDPGPWWAANEGEKVRG